MGSTAPSIHISIDRRDTRPPSPSVSEEEEDGVQVVSPDEISPEYSIVQAPSQSGSSSHPGEPLALPYPQDLADHESEHYLDDRFEPPPRAIQRSRHRSESSRSNSVHREPSRRVAQLRNTAHRPRQRPPPEGSLTDDGDSTEEFLEQPDVHYRMPRPQSYYGPNGYTQSSSSGSYTYPPVPHHSQHQMVHYAPPPPPQHYPPPHAPVPNSSYGYPPTQPGYHPGGHGPPSHITSPYSNSPYGPPTVMQYGAPSGYFSPQFGAYPQYPAQWQQMPQYQGMPPPPPQGLPPHMYYAPPGQDSPRPAAVSPAPSASEPKVDEEAIMKRMEAMLIADREARETREKARELTIQSAEDRAAAMSKADEERRNDEKRIRAEALKAAEDEAAHYRKMQAERVEEERRIRAEALRAAEEEAVAARKREAERAAEEKRIREEARREAIEAEKARAAAEAERAAEIQRIRKEAAEAALAAAAAEAKARQDLADREAEIAAKAAAAAQAKAEKEAKEKAEAAEADAKAAKEKADAEAKTAKDEVEAKLKEATEAAEAAKKEAEAAEAKAKDLAPPEKKAPLRFKDALGRNYNFPWDRCYRWEDMEGLIHQAFAHIENIGPHVTAGRYDLIGPDKEIIMPDYWEDSISPGMHITMMLWPIPEPPEPDPELDPDPVLTPLDDGGIIDIDAMLAGVKANASKSKSKEKANSAKKSKPGGFASWMLGGNPSTRGRQPLKGDKKPDSAAGGQAQHDATSEGGACIVM